MNRFEVYDRETGEVKGSFNTMNGMTTYLWEQRAKRVHNLEWREVEVEVPKPAITVTPTYSDAEHYDG